LFKKKKNKYSQKKNLIISGATLVVFVLMGIGVAHANRAPSITVSEPQNEASIQAKTIGLKGKVNPSSSVVAVNNIPAQVDKEGNFNAEAALNDETNTITVTATNGGKTKTSTVIVKRIFTPEEIAERDRIKAEAEAKKKADAEAAAKAQADAEAKAKADQAAYDNSKAGKLCKAHPTWSKDDCDTIAAGKVRIGMSKEQAIASWGKPQDINSTSTAFGTHEQWVYNLSSYLYFDNDTLTTIQN
jgi:hypothetical protein